MTTAVYRGDPTRDERYKQAVAYRWVQAWQTALEVEAGLASRTRLDYLRSVAVFVIQHDMEPAEWTHRDFAATLATFPAGSRRKVTAHLNSFAQWLEDEDVIDRNPMRKLRKPKARPQQVPNIFDDADWAQLSTDPLACLMLNTGLRKGECRRLQRRHLHLDREDMTVMLGKGGKSRVVPLNRAALKAVADLDLTVRLNPDDHLWGSRPGGGSVIDRSRPVGEATFARWWTQTLERLGVDYRNPHVARHTFATRYLRAGGRLENLRMILGHASSRTTVDLYAHLDLSDARADVLLLDAMDSKVEVGL